MICGNSDCSQDGEFHISVSGNHLGLVKQFEGRYCMNHLLDKLCFTFKDLYRTSDQTK